MKKSLKVAMGAALVTSALTPVAAFAAETTDVAANGFYNIDTGKFYTTTEFKALTKTEKQDVIKNFHLVSAGKVYKGFDIITLTNDELNDAGVLEAQFEEENDVTLTSDGKVLDADGNVIGEESPVVELTVESVSAINATGVDVTFEAADADRDDQTIEVRDNKNNVVPVKPITIAAGDTTATFNFVTSVDKQEGVWTIGGVTYDFDEKAKLAAVLSSANQIELLGALNDLGIKNVNEENLGTYLVEVGKLDADSVTVADVQKVVNDVNSAALSQEEKDAIVKAVQDADKAGNQVALLKALQNDAFEKVNADWINSYQSGIVAGDDTVEKIQAKIDTANDTKVKAELTALGANSIDKSKLQAAQALIDAYATVDEEGVIKDSTIKAAPESITEQLAIVNVLEATTPTRLKAALTSLASLDSVTAVDMDNYIDENGKAYITHLAKATTTKNTAVAINTALTDTNAAEETSLLGAVATAAATPGNGDTLVTALKNLGLEQVATSNKAQYVLDASGFATAAGTTKTVAAVKAQLETSNAKAVNAATDATKLLEALKVLELDNIVDANKDAYLAAKAGNTADTKANAQKIVADGNAAVKADADAAAFKDTHKRVLGLSLTPGNAKEIKADDYTDAKAADDAYNKLSSAAKAKLSSLSPTTAQLLAGAEGRYLVDANLINGEGNMSKKLDVLANPFYAKLSEDQKKEVAKFLIVKRNAMSSSEFASFSAIPTTLSQTLVDYKALLNGVNTAEDKAEMALAVGAINTALGSPYAANEVTLLADLAFDAKPENGYQTVSEIIALAQ